VKPETELEDTAEGKALDELIAVVMAERKQFGLASQVTCFEIEDRLEVLREQRVAMVEKLQGEKGRD
jgi:hypothetical protein